MMISREKVLLKFQQLDEYLKILKQISATSKKSFLKDKIVIGSAKYYLQVSIECCLDVTNHIIASEKLRAPRDYSDSFKVLQENGFIDFKLGDQLRHMAKFRNRLVHLYGEIDDAYVFDYIKGDIANIQSFKSIILKHINT